MPDHPVLDAARTDELGRVVLQELGFVRPRVDEIDWWCQMPLRLIVDQAGGFQVECGPYTFDQRDIERLRAAIAAYDEANGGPQ